MAETDTAAGGDFMTLMKGLQEGTLTLDDCPESFVEGLMATRKQTREELVAEFEQQAAREARAPRVGDRAPDFELELLDAQGNRTDTTRRLSASRDRPVALAFGSYT